MFPPRPPPGSNSFHAVADRKNDRIDAAAAACVAASQGDCRTMVAEDPADALPVLDEHRVNLTQARVGAVNQSLPSCAHSSPAGLSYRSDGRNRECPAGLGAPQGRNRTSPQGYRARPHRRDPTPRRSTEVQLQSHRRTGRELRQQPHRDRGHRTDHRRAHHRQEWSPQPVPELGFLRQVRRRRPHPPPPIPDRDRQLNSALHTVAVTQIRVTGSRGNLHYLTKIAAGNTPREPDAA